MFLLSTHDPHDLFSVAWILFLFCFSSPDPLLTQPCTHTHTAMYTRTRFIIRLIITRGASYLLSFSLPTTAPEYAWSTAALSSLAEQQADIRSRVRRRKIRKKREREPDRITHLGSCLWPRFSCSCSLLLLILLILPRHDGPAPAVLFLSHAVSSSDVSGRLYGPHPRADQRFSTPHHFLPEITLAFPVLP